MNAATTANQAVVVSSVGFTSITSAMSLSSPSVVWAMVNQVQLLLLLVLTKTSMPGKVLNFLTSNLFAAFNFGFLNVKKWPLLKDAYRWLFQDQSNVHLREVGVESHSTYNNIFSLLVIFALLAPLHLGVVILPQGRPSVDSNGKKSSK